MLNAFFKTQEDHDKIFYGQQSFTLADYEEWLKDKTDNPFLCYHTKTQKMMGLWWINGIQGKSAYIHYAPLPRCRLSFIKAGRFITDKLLDYFDCLKGLCPETRPWTIRAAEMMGFKKLTVIPNGTYWAETGESINAHLLVKTEVTNGKKSVSNDADAGGTGDPGTA